MGCRRSVASPATCCIQYRRSRRTNPATPSPANLAATAGFGGVACLPDVVAGFAWITPGSPDDSVETFQTSGWTDESQSKLRRQR